MNIIMNDRPIDFELEEESTLGEVIVSVESWLANGGMRVRSIESDGSILDLDTRDDWYAVPIDSIGTVTIVARSPFEIDAEKITSLHRYFVTLRDSGGDSYETVVDLLEEREAVTELLDRIVPPHLAAKWRSASAPSEALDGVRIGYELGRISAELTQVLELRWREISEPQAVLAALLPQAREIIDRLSEVSAYLQNGDDGRAMAQVTAFFEVASQLTRLLYIAGERGLLDPGKIGISDRLYSVHQSGLVGLLDELSEAIATSDTVTIGDLLEYEIGPRFLGLLEALERADIAS
jgi:hypothetical protein